MPNRGICIIFDEQARAQSLELAETLGIRATPLSQARTDAPAATAVVVNTDLGNLAQVGSLRETLRSIGSVPRLIAVERGARAHASEMQANALGATRVIQRPFAADDLRQALLSLGVPMVGSASVAVDNPATASIEAGARMLEASFRAFNEGAPLEIAAAVDAGRELLAGVPASGVSRWLDTVRAHHQGTLQHCLLVTGLATAFAAKADMSEARRLTLVVAALLHDIGKAGIAVEILDKPGKLTDAEFEVMKSHPVLGRDYLAGNGRISAEIISAVAHHHEYLDGSGYPDRLRGDEIGPLTRALTVCDVYGALVEQRAYKTPKTPVEAMMILHDMAGRGKVDYAIVRILGDAVGVPMPARLVHVAAARS